MTRTIDDIISATIGVEGGYSNNPNDRGGPTRWGITEQVARAYGYVGTMEALPRETAVEIYRKRYFLGPHLDQVQALSPAIAAEVFDTGVNMGTAVPITFLQRALNVLNRQGRDYGDVTADGQIGPMTIAALKAYLARRGADGERRLLIALNSLQGARYIELAEARPANEDFEFGWLDRAAAG
jgi:lysozyme family protein